jgi:hypothetical protein
MESRSFEEFGPALGPVRRAFKLVPRDAIGIDCAETFGE